MAGDRVDVMFAVKELSFCMAAPRNRLLALLNQLGASDPGTLQNVGQEEYEIAAERTQNQQSLKRLSKAIFRMAAA